MRILINAVSAKSGGGPTYIKNLARALVHFRAPHVYFFCVPSDLANTINNLGANIVVIDSDEGNGSPLRRVLWDQIQLRSVLKRERIDVLISSSDFAMIRPPCPQVLLLRNALFFSPLYVQAIVARQSWRSRFDFYVRKCLVLISARYANVLITASRTMLEDVKRGMRISPNKAVLNHFGVPLERFVPQAFPRIHSSESSRKCFKLLHVSTYSDYKNLTSLLLALRILAEQGTCDISLVTTADPWQFPEAEVVSRRHDQILALNPRISPLVHFRGNVPYEEISKLYIESDLFIFPSLIESFGHPLVEAMASGLAILASDIPICREVCGEAAVYFNPCQPEDLAEKILRLSRSPSERQQLSDAGRLRAQKQFDWNDHVQRLIDTIEIAGAIA